MEINVEKLTKELIAAGLRVSGCNTDGVVWSEDGTTEIQDLEDVKAVLEAHDPTPEVVKTAEEEIAELKKQVATLTEAIGG